MATKLSYDPDQIPPVEQAVEASYLAESGGAPVAALPQAKEELLTEQTSEPSMPNRYRGYVRVGIFVGGAVACWAALAGVISLVL